MSNYTYTFSEEIVDLYSDYPNKDRRALDIQIIKDLRDGNGFSHFKNRFLNDEETKCSKLTDKELKKMYLSKNPMNTVVKKFTSYCPTLKVYKPPESEKARDKKILVDKALKEIKWESRINNIYDSLETKGDVFYHIYFKNKNDKIPRLKHLKSENITNILLDENDEPIAYVYKEFATKRVLYSNGDVNASYTREVTWVLEKGKTTIYDPYMVDGKIQKNKYNKKVILNRASYADKIAIVRIPSYLLEGEEFSDISASHYIEHCLTLDRITSDINLINRMLGFPQMVIVNGKVVKGKRIPGGFIYVKDDENNNGSKAEVKDFQISNKLDSYFTDQTSWEDALYDEVGLVNKSLQLKLGSSDSSRVLKQLNAPLENKIELYVDNIIEAMSIWFEILLKENGLYEEELDYGVSFFKPPFLVKNSIFDQQIYESNELAKNTKTKDELEIERGDSILEVEKRAELVQESNLDISNESTDTVRSSNNL